MAFRDIAPVGPIHVLVVPRQHITDATQLGPEEGHIIGSMFAMARAVAEREGILESGYRLVLNVGRDALNSVPHLHIHVIGGRSMAWPPG
jgi:histidine triad (HIT) family protein